jgi:RNA ligase
MLKIKFDEYKRLHKILTGVSPKSIWEVLKDTGDLSAILENVPDEFYKWVTETAENIENSYYAIEDVALEEFKKIIEIVYPQDPHRKNRKLWAEEIKKMTHPQIGFAMLDGKEYCDLIYKLVKPKGGEVFKQDEL